MKFNRSKHIILLVIVLLLSVFKGYSQKINVHAYLDTTTILIGDQIKFHLEITHQRNIDVTFPLFLDTLMDKVEILEQSEIDTTYLSADLLKLDKELTITSFDSGFYVLPPLKIPYVENNNYDTALSEALVLGVYTFEIDSVTGIADIKAPIDTPLTFDEIIPWVGYALLGLLLILIIIWLAIKYKRKEPIIIKREKPKEPAHIIALRDLDRVKDQKLWQQGKVKEYYSELTAALRVYLENRYQVHAMEQTSDEIITQLEETNIMDAESFGLLKEILYTSDFVKFAKFEPLPDQNEKSLDEAYKIVLKTKLKQDLTSKKEGIYDKSDKPSNTSDNSEKDSVININQDLAKDE